MPEVNVRREGVGSPEPAAGIGHGVTDPHGVWAAPSLRQVSGTE